MSLCNKYLKLIFFLFSLIISQFCLADNANLIIRRIIFEGNESFSANQLKNIILLSEGNTVDRALINDDVKRITDFYHSREKFMLKINPPSIIPVMFGERISGQYADVIFKIEEYPEPIIHTINFTENQYFSDDKLREFLNLSEFSEMSIADIKRTQINLTDLYLSRGFLFVETKLNAIKPVEENQQFLSAEISIKEGKISRANNFTFRGNNVTQESLLLKYSRLQAGQVLNPQNMNQASRRLESKVFIKNAYILPMNENTVLIDIEEDRMTKLSAVLGYSNSKNVSNKFNGFINADFLNLMGSDRNIYFFWRQFQNDFSSVKFKFHESGHDYSPLSADFSLYREEGDSTYTQSEIGLDIYYQGWTSQTFTSQKLGITAEINDLFPGSRRPKIVKKQTDRKIGVFWYLDMTDDYYNPSSGWETDIRQYNHFISKKDKSFTRHSTEFTFQHYHQLKKNIIVANKLNLKYLENKSLTFYDLYRVGGTFSVRGFLEDTFSGNTVFWTNTELRFLLTKFSRVFFFIDYAYIEDNRKEFNTKLNDLIGMGFGIRADTKIGVLRMDYGFNHSQNEWTNPMSGIIHFGIETSF